MVRKCDVCGEDFETLNIMEKRCSDPCKEIGKRRVARAAFKRLYDKRKERQMKERTLSELLEERRDVIKAGFDEYAHWSEKQCDALERELGRTVFLPYNNLAFCRGAGLH